MSDYSWDCYRETIFEQELQRIKMHPEYFKENHIIKYDVERYLEDRLQEIKNKYKD
jgi:hypothetical protein